MEAAYDGTDVNAVFYRGMNLGQPGSPSREQLESALTTAGADHVKSFQTNGTVLLIATDPQAVTRRAAGVLLNVCGYSDAAFVRPVSLLKALISGDAFDGHTDEQTYRETFTFFDTTAVPSWTLPWTNTKDDVDILHINNGVALGVIRKPKNTAGSPTAEIERATGASATTRTRGTIERLVKTAETWNPAQQT